MSMNPNGLRLMELDDISLHVGRPFAEVWPPAAREHIAAVIEAARAGGRSTVRAASDGEGKGSTFTIHLPLSAVHDTDWGCR